MERVKEASFEERHKMEKAYKERLKTMDGKLREVREKERRIAQMERLQARSLEKCSRLQSDILSIKQQKVGPLIPGFATVGHSGAPKCFRSCI